MNDIADLDQESLREQLKARNRMKKDMPIFYGILLIGMICYFAFGRGSLLGLIAFFLFLALFYIASVWYQWNFLRRFNLKCPYCKKPLAERISNYLKTSKSGMI